MPPPPLLLPLRPAGLEALAVPRVAKAAAGRCLDTRLRHSRVQDLFIVQCPPPAPRMPPRRDITSILAQLPGGDEAVEKLKATREESKKVHCLFSFVHPHCPLHHQLAA